jgi:hypothetical protein
MQHGSLIRKSHVHGPRVWLPSLVRELRSGQDAVRTSLTNLVAETTSSFRMKDSESRPTGVELEHFQFASLDKMTTRRFMTLKEWQFGSH